MQAAHEPSRPAIELDGITKRFPGVVALSGDTIIFRLATRGSAESLQRALSLNGRLQPVAGGDNGILRFHLRH